MSDSWRPMPDPNKPPVPYCRGFTVNIRRHRPPQPYGFPSYHKEAEPWKQGTESAILNTPQSQWCLANPPAETMPPNNDSMHRLCVIDEIACGDGRGAQLVRCYLGHQDKKQTYVAKIYDPLYYSSFNEEWGTLKDVSWAADAEYSREAAAYEDIQYNGGDGNFSPKFYGSWTFSIPFPSPSRTQSTRPIRMVLVEWIRGVSLNSLIQSKDIYRIAPKQRLNIAAKAMEAYSLIHFYGVWQKDLAPRNIILRSKDWDSPKPDVIIVDFGQAQARNRDHVLCINIKREKPIHPGQIFNGVPHKLDDWLPEPHRTKIGASIGWSKALWDKDDRFEDLLPSSGSEETELPYELVEPYPDKIPPKGGEPHDC